MDNEYKRMLDAVRQLKEANPNDVGIQAWVANNFPEIQADYAKNVKKVAITLLSTIADKVFWVEKVRKKDVIDWLEKQEPVSWSEQDEKMFKSVMEDVAYMGELPDYPTDEENRIYDECQAEVKWLNSIKARLSQKNS